MTNRTDVKGVMTGQEISARYGVALTGEYQVIKHIFWDTALYTSAATLELIFFNQPRAVNVNQVTTNFYQTGMLPLQEAFLITAIGIGFEWAASTNTAAASALSTPDDIHNLLWNSTMSMNFVHKEYGPIATMCIPQGNGPKGQVSVDFTTAASTAVISTATNGVPHSQNLYAVRYLIEGNQSFFAHIRWSAAQILLGTGTAGTANTNVRFYLFGWWFRQVS